MTHGSDYLTRYAPEPLRTWLGGAAPVAEHQTAEVNGAELTAHAALVKPVLDEYCISCHGPEKSKGRLRLDSFEEGVEKPDPRLFQIALQKAHADAATTIHVGDLYQIDVVGARGAGIRGVLLDEGGLYEDADCPRVRSLEDLGQQIANGVFD